MSSIPGWISAIFGPIRIKVAGVLLGFAPRSTVNFVSGLDIEDDEVNDQTNITVSAGASAPTGTGFPHITAGTQDAAAKLVENADVHASAAIALSKIVNPTGTGVVKATAGVIDAATSTIVNADVSASAAIALSKIVNPTGTGLVKTSGGAISAASALLVNADVDAAAAIAGTKVSPNFGSQAVTTTGAATVGGLVNTGIQTSALTGTQHNFALSADVNYVRLTGAAPVITGITGGTQGRRVVFHATAGNVVFNGQDTNSTAANRITTALNTVQCYQFCAIEFIYDGTSQRWVVMTAIAAPET